MTSTAGLVARFTAVGLAVLAGLAALLAMAARQAGVDQATESASQVAWVTAKGVVEPRLDARVIAGDPAALRGFDDAMHRYVLHGSLVRVKLWDDAGKIIYSDQPALTGTRWTLDDEELGALRQQRIDSEVSDLSRPENRYETGYGKLLEYYVGVRAATGQTLLFEVYFRYDAVNRAGQAAWRKFAPIAIGALVVLQLVQIPLAWSLARRVQRQQRERETLLRHAVEASDAERRRIAGELDSDLIAEQAGGGHFGLRALSDLIAGAHGRLVVRSAPAAGTRVEVEVPIDDPGADRRRPRGRPAGVGAAPGHDG